MIKNVLLPQEILLFLCPRLFYLNSVLYIHHIISSLTESGKKNNCINSYNTGKTYVMFKASVVANLCTAFINVLI